MTTGRHTPIPADQDRSRYLPLWGEAFRIRSVASLTLAGQVLTRAMRERSATLGYEHRVPAFGFVQIV